MLCTVLPTASLEKAAQAFKEIKTPLAELRLDKMEHVSSDEIEQLFDLKRLVIKTTSIAEYAEAAFLDVDHPSLIPKKRAPYQKVIYSIHDFEKMLDVEALIQEGFETGADIVKIAVRVQSTLEALRLLLLQRHYGSRLIAIGMGEEGIITRVAGLKFGMPLSYVAFDAASVTAPGQLTFEAMERIFRASSIDKETALYGLIGSPVSQSIGLIHNQMMERGRYFKLKVEESELDEAISLLEEIGFSGLSVTMPHKMRFTSEGPINTIKWEEGKASYFNTDGEGALLAILRHFTPKSAAILGTGGAAEAVYRRLTAFQIQARLIPRKEFPFIKIEEELVINATPSPMPVALSELGPSSSLMELNVRPTPWIKEGEALGRRVIFGYEMWAYQAALQLKVWFGMDPDVSVKKLLSLAEAELARG